MEALASTIPKEEHHQYVRPLKEAVATATEKERRKRRAAAAAAGTAAAAAAIQSTPLLVAGFCLPKALAPVLPIYLAGVLQGSSTEVRGDRGGGAERGREGGRQGRGEAAAYWLAGEGEGGQRRWVRQAETRAACSEEGSDGCDRGMMGESNSKAQRNLFRG